MEELFEREKFQIDVQERRPVEADEESRFADVVARERRKQRPEPLGDGGAVPQHFARRLGRRDDDEVEVGVLVHLPGDERAARRHAGETHIGLEDGERALEEGAMQRRQRHESPTDSMGEFGGTGCRRAWPGNRSRRRCPAP